MIRRLSDYSSVSETRKDISIDYEDELDILAVLGTTEFPDSDGGGNDDSVHTRLEDVTLLDGKNYRDVGVRVTSDTKILVEKIVIVIVKVNNTLRLDTGCCERFRWGRCCGTRRT